MSTWYVATQTLNEDSAEQWFDKWSEVNYDKMAAAQHMLGVFRHALLPGRGVNEPMLCLYECKDGMDTDAFQALLETADTGLAGWDFHSQAFSISPGAIMPTSAWAHPTAPALASPSTGSYFWTLHDFLNEDAADAYWESIRRLDGSSVFESPYPDLLRRHCYLPTGQGAADPIFCIWETRNKMSADEFEGFINGPNSPSADLFASRVYHAPSSFALPPAAAFPKRGFMGMAGFPLMDDSMHHVSLNVIRMFEPKEESHIESRKGGVQAKTKTDTKPKAR
jgi:hypothetical protein